MVNLLNKFSLLIYKSENKYIGLIIILYICIFGWLLNQTNGMPYVTDNNETYSSIIHAKSISNYGLVKSSGFADEAYGPSESAHPYVHSHQGNYPRFYSWLIYEMGAKEVESQIVVTTFTIGLFSILLAFLFIKRLSNNMFAILCCVVYMSDYLFFSQWQVVTYRVWYSFLFFLQFLIIENILKFKNPLWLIILIINTAFFCYGELIFAAYLGLFSLIWVFVRFESKKLMFITAMSLAIGLFVSLLLLYLQGVDYLGIELFKKDIELTFSARNQYDNKKISIEIISKFYQENNVVFWENISSRNEFINPQAFIGSILYSFCKVYGPILSILILLLFAHYFIQNLWTRNSKHIFKYASQFREFNETIKIGRSYLVISSCYVLLILISQEIIYKYFSISSSNSLYYFLVVEVLILSTVLTIQNINKESHLHYLFVLYTFVFVALSEGLQSILNNDYSILWSNIYGQLLVENFVWILPIIITTLLIFSNYKIEILSIKKNKIDLILHFLFVGLVAYGIIYYVSPGYINSGYTVRMAPFFIFIFDMGIGLAIYLPTLNALQTYRNFKKIKNANEILNAIYTSLFFIFIIILWFNMQYKYLKLLPPNHFYVLDKLSKEPYKGHSFVSDNYAAPVSVQTEQWAYFDPVIARALFVETKEGNKLIGDKRYLWLADKNTNNEYRKPNYFICMQGQNIETVLFDLKNKNKMLTGCFDIPIIRLARNSQYNGITLVEYDEVGAKRTGFVSWAIVKFEWKKFQLDGLVWESDLKK